MTWLSALRHSSSGDDQDSIQSGPMLQTFNGSFPKPSRTIPSWSWKHRERRRRRNPCPTYASLLLADFVLSSTGTPPGQPGRFPAPRLKRGAVGESCILTFCRSGLSSSEPSCDANPTLNEEYQPCSDLEHEKVKPMRYLHTRHFQVKNTTNRPHPPCQIYPSHT